MNPITSAMLFSPSEIEIGGRTGGQSTATPVRPPPCSEVKALRERALMMSVRLGKDTFESMGILLRKPSARFANRGCSLPWSIWFRALILTARAG
jgi:hypothetical protein